MGTLQRNIKRLFANALIAKAFYPICHRGHGVPDPLTGRYHGSSKRNNKAGKNQKLDFVGLDYWEEGSGIFRNRTTGVEVVKRIASVGGKEGKGFSRNAALYFGVTA